MKNLFNRLRALAAIAAALLLGMAGLSGSILAFYDEVDAWLNPQAYAVTPAGDMLAPPQLIERLEQARPEVRVWYLQYPQRSGRTAMMTTEPRPGSSGELPAVESNVFFVNPYTGEVVSERYWGRCCFEPENFLNFIYEMHHSLHSGRWGGHVMALAAIVLLLNCLWVLYRSLRVRSDTVAAFLIPVSRRGVAVIIALGFLPLAVSSIALNLTDEVFKPVVSWFSPVQPGVYSEYAMKDQSDFGERVLSYKDAWLLAQDKGAELGWSGPVAELFYSSGYNFYGMAFGYRDPAGLGNNWMYLDGASGELVGSKTPRDGSAGDLVFFVQLPIHSGRLVGLPSKLLVTALGLLLTWFSLLAVVRESRELFAGRHRQV